MKKTRRKVLNVLVALSFLMTLLVPFANPALAISDNHISRIMTINEDWNGDTGVDLLISEDGDYPADFNDGDVFQLILPSGVNWNPAAAAVTGSGTAVVVSDQILEVTMAGTNPAGDDTITINMDVEIDGATGDIAVEVDPMDAAVSAGSYVFARVLGDNTIAKALSVETIGDPGVGGDIRIEESSLGSLGYGYQTITLELPKDFEWATTGIADIDRNGLINDADYVTFSGGFSGLVNKPGAGATVADGEFDVVLNGEEMVIYFDPTNVPPRSQRGLITINTPIDPQKGADYGEIEVNISGTVADDADVVVAEYADYGVEVSIDEVEEIKAGKFDQELDTIVIEENVPGTLLANRDITLVLPAWVKITDANVTASGGGIAVTPDAVDGTDNELDITITSSSAINTGKIEVDLEISVQGDKTGEIELTVEGRKAGMNEDATLVVGDVIGLVEAEVESVSDVKIGVQSQPIADVTITELAKGVISDDPNGNIDGEVTLTLPEGVKFAGKPTVKVVEGNLDIEEDDVSLASISGSTDNRVVIPIDDASNKASQIKLSNIKVTVDRTVPTGDLVMKVGGGAIIENQKANNGWLGGRTPTPAGSSNTIDEGEFDLGTAVKIKVANIITPAPGETSGIAEFKIGEAKYTLNGAEVTMDVAPYIKGDRTYMPVRFVAQALGVAESNIIWNQDEQTVVLIKGDRIVKLAIGSTTMYMNGVAFTMDVAPEIVDPGRTMLPVRWVAQALGADVQWDEATQTVTVELK